MRGDDDDNPDPNPPNPVGALVDATSTEHGSCVSESHKVPVLKFQYGRPMAMAALDEDEKRGEGRRKTPRTRGLGCNAPENSNEESALLSSRGNKGSPPVGGNTQHNVVRGPFLLHCTSRDIPFPVQFSCPAFPSPFSVSIFRLR